MNEYCAQLLFVSSGRIMYTQSPKGHRNGYCEQLYLNAYKKNNCLPALLALYDDNLPDSHNHHLNI